MKNEMIKVLFLYHWDNLNFTYEELVIAHYALGIQEETIINYLCVKCHKICYRRYSEFILYKGRCGSVFGYIYLTTNLNNGKMYIGQHINCRFNKKYFGSGKLLKKAIIKYGVNNFLTVPLLYCSTKIDLDNAEKYFIQKLKICGKKKCYNLANGGANGSIPLMQAVARRPEIRAKAVPKIMNSRRIKFNGDASPWFHKKEVVAKRVNTRKERYGDAGKSIHTELAKKNAKLARIRLFGSSNGMMMTKNIRDKCARKVSTILEFDNKIFIGYNNLYKYILNVMHIDISMGALRRLANNIKVLKYDFLPKIKIVKFGSVASNKGNKVVV